MTRTQFTRMVKNMLKDRDAGYYGMDVVLDEIWYHISDLQNEVKNLRKKATLTKK